jgi:hypothetical protein
MPIAISLIELPSQRIEGHGAQRLYTRVGVLATLNPQPALSGFAQKHGAGRPALGAKDHFCHGYRD